MNLNEKTKQLYQELIQKETMLKESIDKNFVINKPYRFSALGDDGVIIKSASIPELQLVLQDLISKKQVNKEVNIFPKWLGYTLDEWIADVNLRLTKINATKLQAEIKELKQQILATAPKEVLQEFAINDISNKLSELFPENIAD